MGHDGERERKGRECASVFETWWKRGEWMMSPPTSGTAEPRIISSGESGAGQLNPPCSRRATNTRLSTILRGQRKNGFDTHHILSKQMRSIYGRKYNYINILVLRQSTHSPSPSSDIVVAVLTVGMVAIHLSQQQGLGWVVAGQQLPQARNTGKGGGTKERGSGYYSCLATYIAHQALFMMTQLKGHAPLCCLLTSAVCRHRQPPATAAPSAPGAGGSRPRWLPVWHSGPALCWPPQW